MTTLVKGLPFLLGILAASCSTVSGPAARGEAIYKRLCATCHDVDPSRDRPGSFGGPPVTGSSRELLEAKVVGNQYPDGYSPKRPTQFMLPLSGVTPAMLDELAAYLSAQRTPSEPSGN